MGFSHEVSASKQDATAEHATQAQNKKIYKKKHPKSSSQVKFLLSTQTQNSPPLVRSAVDNSEQGSQSG